MLVKTHDHIFAANDHRHAARTRDSDHFIQSVAVFADIKLNVLDSLSRKELLRLATVVSSREAVNPELLHTRLLRFMLLLCRQHSTFDFTSTLSLLRQRGSGLPA